VLSHRPSTAVGPSSGRWSGVIEHGLLLLSCGYREQVLRLIPALNVNDGEADEGLTTLEEADEGLTTLEEVVRHETR